MDISWRTGSILWVIAGILALIRNEWFAGIACFCVALVILIAIYSPDSFNPNKER